MKKMATIKAIPGFKAAAGRPKSNVGKFVIKPTGESPTGTEMLNTKPDVIEAVEESLSKWDLPPALQPKYIRKPEVMEAMRADAISKGWRRPRSRYA